MTALNSKGELDVLDTLLLEYAAKIRIAYNSEAPLRNSGDARRWCKQAIEQYCQARERAALEALPLATSTSEELDKSNTHLDSRSQRYWSAYSKGYISFSDQVRERLAELYQSKEDSE